MTRRPLTRGRPADLCAAALLAGMAALCAPSAARAHSDASSFGGGAGVHDHVVEGPASVPGYPARVMVDPRRVVNVTMRVNARITAVLSGPPRTRVSAGEPLARFTSAELDTLQTTYIETYRARDVMMAISMTGEEKLIEGRMNLRWRGLSEDDVAAIERTRTPVDEVTIFAPIDGYITQVNIGGDRIVNAGTRAGLFTASGSSVFQIADPGALLIEASVPIGIAEALRPGDTLSVSLHGAETAEAAAAVVDAVLPLVDPATPWARTVRLTPGEEIARALRPGQMVTVLPPDAAEQHVVREY